MGWNAKHEAWGWLIWLLILPMVMLFMGILMPIVLEVRRFNMQHPVMMKVAIIVLVGLIVGFVCWKRYKKIM